MRDARGRFLPGPDPRRHRFTRDEQRRGFLTTARQVLAGKLSQRWLAGRVKTTIQQCHQRWS